MSQQQTVTLNGVPYDAVTGLPLSSPRAVVAQAPKTHKTFSHDIHKPIQKSSTLNRTAVQKTVSAPVSYARTSLARSPQITKFAAHPTPDIMLKQSSRDIGPSVHPMVRKVSQQMETPAKSEIAPPRLQPASVIKQHYIEDALEQAPSHRLGAKHKAKPSRQRVVFRILATSLSVLLLAGYFTYLNLPNISLRVAAMQAGINARYPGYRPDGYRLAGINNRSGQVTMKFASNASPQSFILDQKRTSWDSTALRENIVKQNWSDNVITYTERGLTIYSNNNNALWVNGGILYTLSGDAPLSAGQIRSLAASL